VSPHPKRIYVASSWRNLGVQRKVVETLREAGHEVYDFTRPREREYGFSWSKVDPEWKSWTPETFREKIFHPVAQAGFDFDMEAMKWADCCVMVNPCGRSAHLEAGYFVGANKPLLILLSDGEPELMYKMSDYLCISIEEVVDCLQDLI